MNMPIYRAKKIDSDKYVTGYLSSIMIISNSDDDHIIDKTTLSIHFPDMLDSQGNKIFASLSEDGKGGDVINFPYDVNKNINETVLFKNIFITNFSNFKVIGIQE